MAMQSSTPARPGPALSAVATSPLQTRPGYILGMEEDPDDIFHMTVGRTFCYVIPSFDVLAVRLCQMKIVGQHQLSGEQKQYDLFVRDDASLCRSYPSRMTVKQVVIEVKCSCSSS